MVKTTLLVHMFGLTFIQVHAYGKKKLIDGYDTMSIEPQLINVYSIPIWQIHGIQNTSDIITKQYTHLVTVGKLSLFAYKAYWVTS